VKSALAGLVTTSVAVPEWIRVPDAPVIEKLYVPAATDAETVTTNVAEAPAAVGLTLNAAQVAPVGNPGQVNETMLPYPPTDATLVE
jgi:hypothetical protein